MEPRREGKQHQDGVTKSFLRPVAPVEDKLKLDFGAKGNRFRARRLPR
jgi:hypothetical protein